VWAQLIKMQVKPEREDDLPGLMDEMRAMEQSGSGLIRTMTMRDQNDPSALYVMVVFGSEEQARAREQDPRRQEAMTVAQAHMAEIFDGAPEFIDLDVVAEVSP